jgi:dCMP deaminase
MDICEVLARRSTCFRGNCGALVVLNRDIVSSAYNGPPPGDDHCKGNQCERTPDGGCLRSIHAERNAVSRASTKLGLPLGMCEMYTLYSPCAGCADFMLMSGVRRVFFRYRYRIVTGLEHLLRTDCEVSQVTPAGMVINERTKEILI